MFCPQIYYNQKGVYFIMKKFFYILLTVIIALGAFTSCSSKKTDTKNTKPEKTETNVSEDNTPESEEITLYFPDSAALYLHPEKRTITSEDDKEIEKIIVSELIAGPEDKELKPSILGSVKVLSAKTQNGVCTVDLSAEFAQSNVGGSAKECMAIYSIVNSLCLLDSIDTVKINIEGNETPDFGGHFDLSEPLTPDTELIQE